MTNMNLVVENIREVKTGIFAEVVNKIEHLEKIAGNIEFTNLKLHNVSYHLYKAVNSGRISENLSERIFSNIAETEYELFQAWEEENLYYVARNYIGLTSSFYYDSNWYGDIICNEHIEELLHGKSSNLISLLGGLEVTVYDVLVSGMTPKFNNDDDMEDFLSDLENDSYWLDELSGELDTTLEIVEEALSAYEYISLCKNVKYEEELAENYIASYLEDLEEEEKGDI